MNPTPPLQIKIFKKASDKKPQNEKLETAIGNTGCTTSCIPLKMAKMHNLKIEKVDHDKPEMKSYQGSGMEVIGQTKFFLHIQTRKGFTTKKMLHCLVVDKTYDHEILISWDNCILMGIIPESFPYCFLEEDLESESTEENVEKKRKQTQTMRKNQRTEG